jgi:hypothetical protein
LESAVPKLEGLGFELVEGDVTAVGPDGLVVGQEYSWAELGAGFDLEAARLGFAVVGQEGASAATLRAADVVCGSILDALDLLVRPDALAATLRP